MPTVTAYYNENNKTLTNDEIKEYLKTGFEAGEAYLQTVIESLEKDYPNLDTSVYNNLSDISSKGIGIRLSYDNLMVFLYQSIDHVQIFVSLIYYGSRFKAYHFPMVHCLEFDLKHLKNLLLKL